MHGPGLVSQVFKVAAGACWVPGADALLTMDLVKRWTMTLATSICVIICLACGLFMYYYLWFRGEPPEEVDPWVTHDEKLAEAAEAKRNATETARLEQLEEWRIANETIEREKNRTAEEAARNASGNATNATTAQQE